MAFNLSTIENDSPVTDDTPADRDLPVSIRPFHYNKKLVYPIILEGPSWTACFEKQGTSSLTTFLMWIWKAFHMIERQQTFDLHFWLVIHSLFILYYDKRLYCATSFFMRSQLTIWID